MTAYYNEFDPQAAAWLRELIKAGLICAGEVDERSIADVKPDDLRGFVQCHFFAGIGGWSYALRLAGWADDRPCWTGSPPCQPFSNTGKQKGKADARHLWPVFFNLVRECRPANIFGEQVEAAIRTGWLDDLQDDLEAENYATGKIVLPACSIGGYHIRQRIWFVAERLENAESGGRNWRLLHRPGESLAENSGQSSSEPKRPSGVIGLANATDNGHIAADGLRKTAESQEQTGAQDFGEFARSGDNSGVAESDSARREQRQRHNQTAGHGHTTTAKGSDDRPKPADAPNSIWRNPDWLWCRDGKWRPVEPGTFPLAHGVSASLVQSIKSSVLAFFGTTKITETDWKKFCLEHQEHPQLARIMRLKGYGNAIVPQVAAEIIKAYMEAQQ